MLELKFAIYQKKKKKKKKKKERKKERKKENILAVWQLSGSVQCPLFGNGKGNFEFAIVIYLIIMAKEATNPNQAHR